MSGVGLILLFILFCETGSPIESRARRIDWLPSKSRDPPVSASPALDYTCALLHRAFLYGFWG